LQQMEKAMDLNDIKILIVDDETDVLDFMKYNLEKEGFEVKCVDTGGKAFDALEERLPDLIVLDWMIPEMSGIEICNEIRFSDITRDIPIIMLTARSQESDRLKGFTSGADDYMTKPFSPKELIARINSVLRRAKPNLMGKPVFYDAISVDVAKKIITANGIKLDLSPLEFSLLYFFLTKPEKVLTREMLLRNVWNDNDSIESRTVDVCIRRLRTELGKAGKEFENMIKTVRGEGYILEK